MLLICNRKGDHCFLYEYVHCQMLGVMLEEGHASILFVCLGSCLSVVLLFIQWHRTTVNEHHMPNPSKTRNVPTIAQPVDRTSGRSKFTPSTFPEDQSFNKRGKPRRRKNNRFRQQLNHTLDRPTEFIGKVIIVYSSSSMK